jgi:hypothetical protein
MHRLLVILVLVTLVCPARAHALSFCVRKDPITGAVREGASVRLRATCKPREKALAISIEDGERTVRFSGVNVQIVSGAGATDAPVNGMGNLIVGYDADTGGYARTGSHNVVVGDEHTYSSYGGIVAGFQNAITGQGATVSGGSYNIASGRYASVTGGSRNAAGTTPSAGPALVLAPGEAATVSGGYNNAASGIAAAVSGGVVNTSSGDYAAVSGGEHGTASGFVSSVTGGAYNVASGPDTAVSGGFVNIAGVYFGSVSGGAGNVAGSGTPPTPIVLQAGQAASVCGGLQNTATGAGSTVGGGTLVGAAGANEWHTGQTAGFPTGTEY